MTSGEPADIATRQKRNRLHFPLIRIRDFLGRYQVSSLEVVEVVEEVEEVVGEEEVVEEEMAEVKEQVAVVAAG